MGECGVILNKKRESTAFSSDALYLDTSNRIRSETFGDTIRKSQSETTALTVKLFVVAEINFIEHRKNVSNVLLRNAYLKDDDLR